MDVHLPGLEGEQSMVERLKWAEHILGTISKDLSQDGQGTRHNKSGSQSLYLGLTQDKVIEHGRRGVPNGKGSTALRVDTTDTTKVRGGIALLTIVSQ